MKDSAALRELIELVERTGMPAPGSDGVVMLSGGADSACLAAAAVGICGPQAVTAVHLNYGLRDDSGQGEDAARRVCAMLRIDLHIERPELGEGNLQMRARTARYEAAERLRSRLGATWIATGHTRTDMVETLLYRLAVSPGTRAMRGLRPSRDRVIRPLHQLDRGRVRDLARAADLPFADDPTNSDLGFARNRIRAEVLPVLREIGPELERNAAATLDELAEEGDLLERLAASELERLGIGRGGAITVSELGQLDPALRRLALRRMAEDVAERPIAIGAREVERITRALQETESKRLELGRGLRAICEAGSVHFAGAEPAAPDPVRLTIPGEASFGGWRVEAEVVERPPAAGPHLALLEPETLEGELELRSWRHGDSIRPAGLGGSKSLQDLFVDSKVPRSLRKQLPVVVSGGEIVWVAGLRQSERHRFSGTGRAVALSARAIPA